MDTRPLLLFPAPAPSPADVPSPYVTFQRRPYVSPRGAIGRSHRVPASVLRRLGYKSPCPFSLPSLTTPHATPLTPSKLAWSAAAPSLSAARRRESSSGVVTVRVVGQVELSPDVLLPPFSLHHHPLSLLVLTLPSMVPRSPCSCRRREASLRNKEEAAARTVG
jgi:hypothetical protein